MVMIHNYVYERTDTACCEIFSVYCELFSAYCELYNPTITLILTPIMRIKSP